MRDFTITVDIGAPPHRVWQVMTEVERWPEWTASVTSIKRLNRGPFDVGSKVVIRQPKFPPALWVVTDIQSNRSFTWKSGAPGIYVFAHHSIEPTATGCRVTLSLRYNGMLGGLLGRMTAGITNRYLAMEAAGLKQRAETA
jgi:hypothetical protein